MALLFPCEVLSRPLPDDMKAAANQRDPKLHSKILTCEYNYPFFVRSRAQSTKCRNMCVSVPMARSNEVINATRFNVKRLNLLSASSGRKYDCVVFSL